MDLLLTLSALRRNGANKIHVFISYMCYCRMDRPSGDYRSTSGADVLQLISFAGANSLSVLDAHSEILLGSVPHTVSCRNLNSNSLIEKVITELGHENLTIVSPDAGAIKRCKSFIAEYQIKTKVELEFAVIEKTRKKPNEVHSIQLMNGIVAKRNCLILDDMVDTGVNLIEHTF